MAQLMLVNPRKRKAKKRKSTRLATTRTVTTKRYRRNPAKKLGGVQDTFMKGAVGAAGALAVDVAMQKLPIPANLKAGMLAPAVRGVVGIGIGMAVAKLGKNKKLGTQLADGAVTVALYGTGKQMLAPALGLSDDLLGADALMYYDDADMGYWDGDDDEELGWSDAAETFDTDYEF